MLKPLGNLDQDSFFYREQQNVERADSYYPHRLDVPILTIIDRWTLSIPRPASTPPGHRPRPSLFTNSIQNCDISVRATLPIRTGRNKWSQVWLGGIVSPETSEASVVVIKVFQESLFPLGDDSDLDSGAKHAETEACSYTLMSSLQGREVPWSCGFFKFKIFQDEIAFGHVMEYVPAPTSALLLEQISFTKGLPLSKEKWTSMIESMAKGLHKIHECGVAHKDLALRNVVMTDCDRLSGAVFLDFAFATQADEDSIKCDAEGILSALMQFHIPQYEIKAWYDSKCTEKWASMFSGVKFRDERKAKQVGVYPNLVKIWANPAPVEWEGCSSSWTAP